MPTELIANPIVNQTATIAAQAAATIPDLMKLDPWFDWQVILGLPFWFFIDIACVLVVITVFLYWVFRMKKLHSVRGYVEAMKKASPFDVMVWIVDAARRLTIECMKITDGTLKFYDPMNITRWHHDERIPPLNIGGQGGFLASEGYFRTRDMVSEIARDIACDQFNANQEQLAKELKESGEEAAVKPITDYDGYEDYGRQMLEQLHPNGLVIPSYVQFDPERDNKYKPIGLTARFNGGIFKRDVNKLNIDRPQQRWFEKYIALGFILIVVVVAIMAAWNVPLTGV